MKRLPALLLSLLLMLSCAHAEDAKAMFTNRDMDPSYQEKKAVYIGLEGDTAVCDDPSVPITDGTIRIAEEGVYVLSGTLTDGMVIVDAPEDAKVQLVLDNAHITSGTSAALYVLEADKVFVSLTEGTENSLLNGGAFKPVDDADIDAAVFAKQDVTFNGSGSLTVTSPAGHGIVGKDDLKFTGGTYVINAASRAIDANDSIRIRDAAITAAAGKDGLRAQGGDDPEKGYIYIESGVLDIQAEGDGISAATTLDIRGGTFRILTGGGSQNGTKASSSDWGRFGGGRGGRGAPGGFPGWEDHAPQEESSDEASTSMKGLKSSGTLTISGGVFDLDTADDAIHTNASATITDGMFTIASGDDAFHAEDTLTVSGGTIDITESYEGMEALHLSIEGGNIRLVSSDDGLNAAGGTDESGVTGGRDGRFGGGPHGGWRSASSDGTIVISGGTLFISASGDGIDANGSLQITGGHVTVMGPTQGDTAVLDYDLTGTISGGTFLGTGAAMMAQTLSGENQGVLSVSVGRQSAGTQIIVTDAEGRTVLEHTPDLSCQIFIYSSPEIVSGQTYTLTVGTISGEITAD